MLISLCAIYIVVRDEVPFRVASLFEIIIFSVVSTQQWATVVHSVMQKSVTTKKKSKMANPTGPFNWHFWDYSTLFQ